MRKLLALLPTALLFQSLAAQQEHRIEVDPSIPEVTVYLSGGEVRSAEDIALKAGRNTVVFKGLSPHTYDESVQIAFTGFSGTAPTILSIGTARNFLDPVTLSPRIGLLMDSVELFNSRISDLDDRIMASEAEREMLARNHAIGGSGVVVSAEQLSKAADFFRERTLTVNRTISALQKERNSAREELARTQRQLAELNYRHDPQRKEVTVVVQSAQDQRVRAELRYLVGNTGWAPVYDLVAIDVTKPLTLRYKAQVYNNTGIDWNAVRLVLSTADPTLGANRPELEPWYLGSSVAPKSSASGKFAGVLRQQGIIAMDSSQAYQTITVAETAAELSIQRPYDIPSDAKPHLVEVAEHEVPAEYSYVAVPKLDRHAFLTARVTGWRELDLVEGRANVYFGGSFVGESRISTMSMDDTLTLSLGRDRNVLLEHKLKEEMTSKRLIGSERKETSTYEITVRNNGSAALTIDILDQVPVSQNSEFKVSVLELSKGSLNEVDGTVTWQTEVPAGVTLSYLLSYSIQYPKGRSPSSVQRYRTMANVKFL